MHYTRVDKQSHALVNAFILTLLFSVENVSFFSTLVYWFYVNSFSCLETGGKVLWKIFPLFDEIVNVEP